MTDGVGRAGGPWSVVGWAVLFAALTSVGLVALAWLLVTMDVLVAIGVGLVGSLVPESEPGGVPILDGYSTALVRAIVANVVATIVVAPIAARTVARARPPWVTGLVSAGLALLIAGGVQLMALGISPLDVFTASL
ncbi:hypothetical protein GA707_11660 [Nostocoides sp. F2B08]|uniref:hypothetical protein n=1 Tax=Nostocoides sp. F2B08 TaxID=2653936 RepID=UPI00126304A4|nr:hypothetical protein [Tetrasphaera sp. F2B08]KAB7744101.1 hypothetical protein GA707_11660 [Tetrasphaera sp. F2B08]